MDRLGPILPHQWRLGVFIAASCVGVIAAGFTAAQLRSAAIDAPMLTQRLGPTTVDGRVVAIEIFPDGARLTLDEVNISRLSGHRSPLRIRVRLRGRQPPLSPGDRVRVRAILSPPSPPAAPGAYDFQRQAFFQGLGGIGFSVGNVEIVAPARRQGFASVELWFSRLRHHVDSRILGHVEGPAGAIIVALITGDRTTIPESLMAAIRDSGLAHLFAISGFNISLVAGFVFAVVRGLLALSPPIALRYPIKKWAAAVSLVGAGSYVLLSGAAIPSQRAFLMLAVVVLAVLVDRRGISMRLVAWAALIVLLVEPEALLGASLQLSFAAVVALVAIYEVDRERRPVDRETTTWPWWILRYLTAVALTTIVATAATAPFAAYHFNRFTTYGLVANMVAVPVTALWIMPWAVIALVLMPTGLEGIALAPMKWGVDLVIWIAERVAAWPGAVVPLPVMPTLGLVLATLGGLWLCLWRRRWRLWGIIGIAAGVVTIATVRSPDVLIDGHAELVAVRTEKGDLAFSSKVADRFGRDIWLRRDGDEAAAWSWPKSGLSDDGRLACDPLGCIYRVDHHVVSLPRTPEALIEDCQVADVVVSTVPVRGSCASAHTVVDWFDLWRNGAHAIWLADKTVRVESVNEVRGNRPWVLRPSVPELGLNDSGD